MKKVLKNKIICPICSRTTKLDVKLTAVSLYFCNKCNHRFTDPKSIIYTEEYKNKYFLEAHSNWFKYPDFKLYNSLKNLFKKKISKNFSILDIGCGNGNFLKYLLNAVALLYFLIFSVIFLTVSISNDGGNYLIFSLSRD